MSQPIGSTPAPPMETQNADADGAAGLRMMAAKIDELVSTTGIAALSAALELAASEGEHAVPTACALADDLAERSARLEQEIGRTLLAARIA